MHTLAAITIAILVGLGLLRAKHRTTPPYRQIPIVTATEKHFYQALKLAAGKNLEIMTKIRLADLVEPTSRRHSKDWWSAFRKISQKHIDFVLCTTGNLEVIAAIELNDKTHQRKDRKKRDQLVNKILKGAGVTLITIEPKAHYSLTELQKTINEPYRAASSGTPESDSGAAIAGKLLPS